MSRKCWFYMIVIVMVISSFGSRQFYIQLRRNPTPGNAIVEKGFQQREPRYLFQGPVGLPASIHLPNKPAEVQSCDGKRFLVYTCETFCGGLGDRQKGIVSAYLIAQLTNRTLLIDVKNPCGMETAFLPNHYDWLTCKNYALNVTKENKQFIKPHVTDTGRLKIPNTSSPVVFVSISRYLIDSLRVDVKSKKLSHMQWLFNVSNEKVVRQVMTGLFRPVERIQREIGDFLKTFVGSRRLACGHIRVGKNPSIPTDRDFHRFRGYPNVTKLLSFFRRFTNGDEYAIYIASDSEDVRQKAATMFGNTVNLNKSIVHIDQFRGAKETACEGFYNAVLEQTLLARCNELLLTKSNFGAMAALFGSQVDYVHVYDASTQAINRISIWNILDFYKFV